MVTTAASTGATSRDTIVCSAVTTWAAATTGSAARCGLPPWPPRAPHRDLEPVHRGHERPRLHPQGAHLELVPEVDAEDHVDSVEGAVLHHRLRAAFAFLGGLEEQAHLAREGAARRGRAPPPRPSRCGRRDRRRASLPATVGGVGHVVLLLQRAARPCPRAGAPWGRVRRRARGEHARAPETACAPRRPELPRGRRPPARRCASPERPARGGGAGRGRSSTSASCRARTSSEIRGRRRGGMPGVYNRRPRCPSRLPCPAPRLRSRPRRAGVHPAARGDSAGVRETALPRGRAGPRTRLHGPRGTRGHAHVLRGARWSC